MKYSEFKAEVEKLGLGLVFFSREVGVVNQFGHVVACISKSNDLRMDMDYTDFQTLSLEKQIAVFDLSYQIAKTPLTEREEEKRYWLQKIPVPLLDKNGEKKWLWKDTRTSPSNMFGVDTTKIDSELYKTIFTESEIAEMDITGFKKIEVMDGE